MDRQFRIEAIEQLWDDLADGRDRVSLDDLRDVLTRLGEQAAFDHLHPASDGSDRADGVTRGQFLATVTSVCGDKAGRLKLAFEILDQDNNGRLTHEELSRLLLTLGVSTERIAHFFAAADRNGDGAIDFDEFRAVVCGPGDHHPHRYRDVHPALRNRKSANPINPAPTGGHSQTPSHAKGPKRGQTTSRLQMQIGLFRLLQGAAYRSFRENFAANCQTHLTAKTMPYTITEFAKFTESAIELYKALGVVDPDCHHVLDAVSNSVRDELERLNTRISTWDSIEKSPEMTTATQAIEAERADQSHIRHVFAAVVEYALTLGRKGLTVKDFSSGALDLHEMQRLRALDLYAESPPLKISDRGDASDYTRAWNRVILDTVDEEIDGAIMPSAYWYDDFMPKLLAACSVSTASDVQANTQPDAASLDRWFQATQTSGEFHPFVDTEMGHFDRCQPSRKLMIKQAWRLTRHYLNGIQKRRERLEFGRETGALSQYVAFLDVCLGRNDVRDANMRLSFPYFIGPSTWRFLHTTAEIVCSRDAAEQEQLIALFKDFFRSFAAMYPCPYCRYHLNRYVIRNSEIDYYPLEYLLLGSDRHKDGFEASIDYKLRTITDGPSLRLFIWKLHNAVSSSITRTESWFRRDEQAFYASRYWPSLTEEVARAQALGQTHLSVEKLSHFSGLLAPVGRLASLRGRWAGMHLSASATDLANLLDNAQDSVRDLEAAVLAGGFLEHAYRFDPDYEDDAPHFTPEEEAYSRSGMFVEA